MAWVVSERYGWAAMIVGNSRHPEHGEELIFLPMDVADNGKLHGQWRL